MASPCEQKLDLIKYALDKVLAELQKLNKSIGG